MMAGSRDRRNALGHDHGRCARGVEGKKRLAPLPHPLLHQPHVETVFAEREADEAGVRAERMMEQCEHEDPRKPEDRQGKA